MALQWWVLWLGLGVLLGCAIVITAQVVLTARTLRSTLQTVQAALPVCEQTVREARQLLSRTNLITDDLETMLDRACRTTVELLEPLHLFAGKAQAFFMGRAGFGQRHNGNHRHHE